MINKVILVGNVGGDPEVRTLDNGTKVARVRMATTERIYNRTTQQAKEHTEWHTLTLWRGLADTADRFVRKGSRIYVEGRLRSTEWTDNAGVKRYGVEILVDDMKLLDRRPEGGTPPIDGSTYVPPATAGQSHPSATPSTADAAIPAEDPDDLPF